MISDFKVNEFSDLLKVDYVLSGKKTEWAIYFDPNKHELIDSWVCVFHGHGSDVTQLFIRDDMKNNWLPKFIEEKTGVICFNTLGNSWMSPETASAIHNILVFVKNKYDVKKFIFVGGSMGGSGVLSYGVQYPEDVSSIISMCPTTDIGDYSRNINTGVFKDIADAIELFYKSDYSSKFKKVSVLENYKKLTMPVFITHTSGDEIIPVKYSDDLTKKFFDKKHFFYYRTDGGNHDTTIVDGFLKDWNFINNLK